MLLTSRPNAALCRRAAHRREAGTVASPSVVLPQTLRAAPQRRTRRAAPAEVFGLEALGVPAEPNPAVQSAAYATLGLAAARCACLFWGGGVWEERARQDVCGGGNCGSTSGGQRTLAAAR